MVSEPPVQLAQITEVNYSSIEFFPIKVSTNNMDKVMTQLSYKTNGDRICISRINASYGFLLLDTQEYNSWKAITNSGLEIQSITGVSGQLAFNVSTINLSAIYIFYVSPPLYFFMLYFSLISTLSFFLLIVPSYFIRKLWVKHR